MDELKTCEVINEVDNAPEEAIEELSNGLGEGEVE